MSLPSVLYIAGPMTASGRADNNYPVFHEAEARLREVGYEVLNPAHNPGPEYTDYVRQGLAQVLQAEGVALLPDWRKSVGAWQERTLALWLGIQCARLETWINFGELRNRPKPDLSQPGLTAAEMLEGFGGPR